MVFIGIESNVIPGTFNPFREMLFKHFCSITKPRTEGLLVAILNDTAEPRKGS